MTEHEVAFVRWYDHTGNAPVPYQGSIHLKWFQLPNGKPWYSVIDIQAILRHVMVQQDSAWGGSAARYYLNKYIRCEP